MNAQGHRKSVREALVYTPTPTPRPPRVRIVRPYLEPVPGERRGWLHCITAGSTQRGGARDGADGAGGIAGGVSGAPRSVALLGGGLGVVAACGGRGGGLAGG